MAETQTVLCADIGTSSLKTALVDVNGVFRAFYRDSFPVERTPHMWYESFARSVTALKKQIARSGERIHISSICVSGNGPTLASPLFIHLWNDENGTQNEIDSYKAKSAPSLFLPRLLYVKEHFRSAWDSSPLVFSGPEFLLYELTGNAVTILPEARFLRAYWSDEVLQKLGIECEKLPPFVAPGFCLGPLTATARADLGLPREVTVYCGAPDFVSALIGTGTLKAGALCDRAGTSEGLNLCTKAPLQHREVRTLPSVISDLYNASFLLPDTGARFSAYKKQSPYAALSYEKTVEAVLNDKSSRGAALMESIATQIAYGIGVLREASGLPLESMRVTGGQARNDAWNRFKADATGVTVEVTATADAELTGDAVIAYTAMGAFASLQDGAAALVKVTKTFTPNRV